MLWMVVMWLTNLCCVCSEYDAWRFKVIKEAAIEERERDDYGSQFADLDSSWVYRPARTDNDAASVSIKNANATDHHNHGLAKKSFKSMVWQKKKQVRLNLAVY